MAAVGCCKASLVCLNHLTLKTCLRFGEAIRPSSRGEKTGNRLGWGWNRNTNLDERSDVDDWRRELSSCWGYLSLNLQVSGKEVKTKHWLRQKPSEVNIHWQTVQILKCVRKKGKATNCFFITILFVECSRLPAFSSPNVERFWRHWVENNLFSFHSIRVYVRKGIKNKLFVLQLMEDEKDKGLDI